jgi:integrase
MRSVGVLYMLDIVEVQEMLRKAKAADREDYLLLYLLANTGRRLGEVMAIRAEDISLTSQTVSLQIERNRDSPTWLNVHIEEEGFWEEMVTYLKDLPQDWDTIFDKTQWKHYQSVLRLYAKGGFGGDLTTRALMLAFVQRLEEAGIPTEEVRAFMAGRGKGLKLGKFVYEIGEKRKVVKL